MHFPNEVYIYFYIEDGFDCWSLDEEDYEKALRRGYKGVHKRKYVVYNGD